LLGAGYTEQVSRAQVAEARAVRRPTVALRVEGRKGVQDPSTDFTRRIESVTGTVTVTQPLWTSGAINSQIRQAIAQNDRDRLNLESIRKQVIQDTVESWENLSAARKTMVTLEEEMKADEIAFYGVREEERYALRTTLDILNAEAELRSAQLNLVRTRSAEYVRRVQLLATIGALDVRTFAPGVTPYDPEKNFNEVKNKGQLPWEPAVRAIDRLGGARVPGPRPATREDTRPAEGSQLPPAPPDAASQTPIVPTSELVARRNTPEAPAEGGAGSGSTAPAPSETDLIGSLAEKALSGR
jgi:outer membrane protein/S-layer protein transport system outer membrane protein